MSHSRRDFLAGLTTLAVAEEALEGAQAQRESEQGAAELRTRISRADLIYDHPVARSEEGMPVGNGRMGTLVWTTPSEVRLQINRVDVYANNSYSNSFIERHNDYCGGCAYVDIDFGAAQNEVFVAPAFKQQLSVYEAVMSLAGKQTSVEMIACPERDVIAAQVHTRGAGPLAGPVEIRAAHAA